MKTDFIWMDGQIIPWDDAQVHVLTHSLHYGSGVFEGIRFYETEKGAAIFRLSEHLDRLYKSAAVVEMDVPYTKEQIREAIIDLIKKNNIKEGYIRPLFFYGTKTLRVNPEGLPVQAALAVWPWGAYLGDEAVKVKTSPYVRIHPKSTNQEAKICGHYVNSMLANKEAKKAGYDEALMLDYEGFVAEGSAENLFIVKDNILYTPTLGTMLPGITRNAVITIARDAGFEVREEKLKLEQVKSADEAFFTGTAAEVSAIASIDDYPFPQNQVTQQLAQVFKDVVRGKKEKYQQWLTLVE